MVVVVINVVEKLQAQSFSHWCRVVSVFLLRKAKVFRSTIFLRLVCVGGIHKHLCALNRADGRKLNVSLGVGELKCGMEKCVELGRNVIRACELHHLSFRYLDGRTIKWVFETCRVVGFGRICCAPPNP